MTQIELGEAIEKGLSMPRVGEGKYAYLSRWSSGEFDACALGLGVIGTFNSAEEAYQWKLNFQTKEDFVPDDVNEGFPSVAAIQSRLNLQPWLFWKVDRMHRNGVSAKTIAGLLLQEGL
jgi:hypothetical protein